MSPAGNKNIQDLSFEDWHYEFAYILGKKVVSR